MYVYGFLAPSTLPLTHQQFCDETMHMGTPTIQEERNFMHILDDFTQALGMEINKIKY